MTKDEIYLFHKTGLPLSWIKYALQNSKDVHKALQYLRDKYGMVNMTGN